MRSDDDDDDDLDLEGDDKDGDDFCNFFLFLLRLLQHGLLAWVYCWYILLEYIVGIYIFQPGLLAYRFRSHRPRPSICEPGSQRKIVNILLPCKLPFVFV